MTERSVSVSLRAKVSSFITGMRQAKTETVDLGRKMTEAGANADNFRKRLEAATKALPKIEIDADSTPAEIAFAQLRAQMEQLASKRIGIDIDDGAARAELAQIERDLQDLQRSNANVSVNADIGTALAELRAIDSEISKVDGKTARVNVNADVAGALSGIAMVGAALAALPAAVSIGVGVAGLGAAFAAAGAGAGAFAAVALPGLARVNEALKQTESAAGGGGAGGAMKSAAQSAAEAASRSLRLAEAQDRVADSAAAVKKAQQGVKDALQGVKEAQEGVRQAQENAASAAARISEVQAAGARRIADAERSVQDAHRATQRAIEDLTRAREQAQEKLEDLALATEGGALAEERAQLSIRRAQQNLNRVNQPGSGASKTDKDEAELALREAEFNLKRLKESNADLAKERAEADAKGVEGSDEVVRAKEAIEAATRREAEAERAVADSRAQAARDVAAAQSDAARAARDVAAAQRDVGDAQRKVAEANAAVIKAQRDQLRATQRLKLEQLQQRAAMEAAGKAAGGGGGAASKMAELSKAERALAEDIKHFTDAYLKWQRELQPDVFPVISQGLGLMERTLPKLTPLVQSSSAAFSVLLTDAEKALAGPFWNTFIYNVNTQIPGAIIGLGRSFGNVAVGAAGVVDAFLPFAPTMVKGVEDVTRAFAEWGQNLKSSNGFHEFILYAQQNAPAVWELIKSVAEALGNIVEAVAPLGAGSLSGLALLARLVAGMDPQHIQMIAIAIAAIKTVQAGLKVASFFSDFGDMIDKTKSKAKDFGTAVGGLNEKFGGLAGSLVGSAGLAGGLLILGDRFSAAADEASRFADVTAAKGGGDLEGQIQSITDELGRMREQVGFSILDTVYFSDSSSEAATKVEALESKLAELTHQQELNAVATDLAGKAIDVTKQRMDGLQQSLDTFAGRTDALQALRNLERAYQDAAVAIEASNGKLAISKDMTDKQRAAVVEAREKFAAFVDSVRIAADGQKTLSGRTYEATKTVLEQLPQLGALAGRNKEAKEQVLLLAQAYGISRADALKAMEGGKKLKDVLAELKSKQIRIDLDTKKAREEFQALLKSFSLASPTIPVGIAAPAKKKAYGGISHISGVELMASGGIRSAGSSPSAMIATSPYMISGRSGPDVIFGEAGWEAYIPLDASKRGRGLDVLGAAASAMGMAVVPQQVAAASSAPSWAGGGSLSGSSASVTVTGVEQLKGSLDSTATTLTGGLADATTAVDTTLGDTGSVTSALQQMTSTLDTQLTALTSAVEGLSGAVLGAGAVAGAAKAAAAGGKVAASGAKIQILNGSTTSAPVQGIVNPSKVSKPVQSAQVVTMVAGSNAGDFTGPSSGESGGGSTSGRPLVIERYYEAEGGSARKTAEELSYLQRRR
ncbi:hypothetical protein ACFYY8_31645 [Streptosporangium sp. NPDC001559]|uniref:hypothetical protein n=1 Tax=Streptosporangium sp. NPDC001559 TaxID=3366187 RepID=UPI0036E635E9